MTDRVVIVGGGVIGTMHAVWARRHAFEVVHLERDVEPRSATVRNFGLVWVSGRAPGAELELALRARKLWEELAGPVPGIGFRPDGSILVAQRPEDLKVIEEVAARADAGARGFHVLDAGGVTRVNPALRGRFLGGLHCTTDAVVEQRHALPALRAHLAAGGGYTFRGGRTATTIEAGRVVDDAGGVHGGDLVIVCPGARTYGAVAELVAGSPTRHVRLQMLQTEPLGERLATSVADGDSLRYYPAFRVAALDALPEPEPVVARFHMQLLISQRAGGELTVGDTHHYEQPFDFAVEEAPYDHLVERAASILGRPLPRIVRRWSGVYSQALDEAICWRAEPTPGVWIVTGPGGRGMTLAPAIAEQTWNTIGEGS